MNQGIVSKIDPIPGAYQHPSINPTLLQTLNPIHQTTMNPNDAAFQQALRHALEVAGQTSNNWNQSPSIHPAIHPSINQSITPSMLHQLNNQPLALNQQPANPQNMHMLNQLINQNTQNLTQMNTQTLSQMNNQSINQLNAHSINQLSALALNPLNNPSSNGQTYSDPHQQLNQLSSMNQAVNPVAQIDTNSYNLANMTPAQIRAVNQSITQSISQLTQNDQMRLAALIDNATRNGAVTPQEIAAILSRSNSQTTNQPMHTSINPAVNPLFNPIAANRPISQPFSQGQPNIAFPRAVRLDASKPSDMNDPSINFPVGQTQAAASQMPWLPVNSSNNQVPHQQVPSMLPCNPMMPTPNSMFHPQTVSQPINPASQAFSQTIIAQLSRPSSTISNDQHIGIKRSINATVTQTPLQQPNQSNQATNQAAEAPTRLSREEAAVHRKLKHREIDAKRRKREKSITDTLAQLSGQASSQALNPKDRLTTMEIAVNKYRSLTHRALKLQNLAKKLESQLVAAGVSIQNEVGYDEDIDDGMNEMLDIKPASGESTSGSDQSANHGAFQPFQSALSQQIASHQLAASRSLQVTNQQTTSQPVNPLLIAPHLVTQLPLSAFQNNQAQNGLSALGNINLSDLFTKTNQAQTNASTQ